MARLIKNICVVNLIVIFLVFVFLFYVKVMAYREAIKKDSIWSDERQCELVTYLPDYRPYGGIGRVLRLFSNQSFFVVYDKNGNKLKSSAWYFWQDQFSDLMAPEWHGKFVLYPTGNGWMGWEITTCG